MPGIDLLDLACGELTRQGLRVVRFDADLYGRPWRPTLFVVPIDYQEDLSNITPPLPPIPLTSSHDITDKGQDAMKKSDIFKSKYLKQADVPAPVMTTIKRVRAELIGDDTTDKAVVDFVEPHLKPFVLNAGNWDVIAHVFGDDSDNWAGKKIVIYADPNVTYKGQRVGGLRVRIPAAKKQPATPAAPPVEELPDIEYEDEIDAEAY